MAVVVVLFLLCFRSCICCFGFCHCGSCDFYCISKFDMFGFCSFVTLLLLFRDASRCCGPYKRFMSGFSIFVVK